MGDQGGRPTTAVDEAGIDVEDFEEIVRVTDRVTEGVRLELVGGQMGAKAVPDGKHDWIINWLFALIISLRPGFLLHPGRGLEVGSYCKGRARPDGVMAPADAFFDDGEWASPGPALMAVEVTSHDSDTNQRDRIDKPAAYAQVEIPVYLLVDRGSKEIVVYSEPDEMRYTVVFRYPFGHAVVLPEPVGIELDTTPLAERFGR